MTAAAEELRKIGKKIKECKEHIDPLHERIKHSKEAYAKQKLALHTKVRNNLAEH